MCINESYHKTIPINDLIDFIKINSGMRTDEIVYKLKMLELYPTGVWVVRVSLERFLELIEFTKTKDMLFSSLEFYHQINQVFTFKRENNTLKIDINWPNDIRVSILLLLSYHDSPIFPIEYGSDEITFTQIELKSIRNEMLALQDFIKLIIKYYKEIESDPETILFYLV